MPALCLILANSLKVPIVSVVYIAVSGVSTHRHVTVRVAKPLCTSASGQTSYTTPTAATSPAIPDEQQCGGSGVWAQARGHHRANGEPAFVEWEAYVEQAGQEPKLEIWQYTFFWEWQW